MDDTNSAELVILPDPTIKLMPFVLVFMGIVGVGLASVIPNIPLLGRIATGALLIGALLYEYVTTVWRLVVGEDAVDIQFTRTSTRIGYPDLDHVIVRTPFGRSLRVVFVTRHPRATIRTAIPMMSMDVRRTAPRLIRALIVHGVDVRTPD